MTVMTQSAQRRRKIPMPFMAPLPSTTVKPFNPEQEDPFRYGFRYVEQKDEQGESKWVQIPLTLHDVLHPEVGDFIVNSWRHGDICDGLKTVCKNQWLDRPGTVVLNDTRVDLGLPGVKPVGPDVALFFDVEVKDDWNTFNVSEEGSKPALIFEVTSPATRHQDFEKKKDYYEQAGVPVYVIVDKRQTQEGLEFWLYGFELINGRYVEMTPDDRDRLWVAPIQAWIEASGPEINCYDINEQPIVDYEEIKRILSDTKIHVQEAVAAKQSAETRAKEAEEAKLAAEDQAQSAETSAKEAEDAKLAAENKAQSAETRAKEAEDRAKAMEEELMRLRSLMAQGSESK